MIASASKWWLLENASSHDYGIQGDYLINITHIFMLLLFVGWGIFFLYCLFRFRASKNPTATYEPVKAKASKYIEVAVVIFEGFLLLGLSIPAWSDFKTRPPKTAMPPWFT